MLQLQGSDGEAVKRLDKSTLEQSRLGSITGCRLLVAIVRTKEAQSTTVSKDHKVTANHSSYLLPAYISPIAFRGKPALETLSTLKQAPFSVDILEGDVGNEDSYSWRNITTTSEPTTSCITIIASLQIFPTTYRPVSTSFPLLLL